MFNFSCCSVTKSCLTICSRMDCSTPGSSVLHFLEFAHTHVHWVSDAVWPLHPLLPLLLLPSVFLSIRVFFSELAFCIRWPKYWSFSISISPSNEYSGLISFTIDWFDLLAVLRILKSLFQHQNSKASILWHSASCGATCTSIDTSCKNHSFDYTDLCRQMMSLLFNMLSRFVIAFLPRSRCLLICSDIICISEIIDFSPSNLDSNLWFIQPGILHDVLRI